MKTLKQLLEKTDKPEPTAPIEPDSVTSYVPKTKDEKRFMDKHVVKKTDDVNGNGDDHFRATNIKAYDRAATRHGYNTKQDQEVYEQKTLAHILGEKKLTPAEMKKREDVAQAIERDNPSMPMGKKMAIATATAKKVAEETEQINEYYDEEPEMIHHKLVDGKPNVPKKVGSKDIHLHHIGTGNPTGENAKYKVVAVGSKSPLKAKVGSTITGRHVNDHMDDGVGGGNVHIHTAKPKSHFMNEDVEQIDELKKSTVRSYMNKKVDRIHKDADLQYPFKAKPISKKEAEKNSKDLMRGHARLSGVKPTSEQVEHLEEGEVATSQYHHYHQEAKKMLEKISKGLDTHSKHVTDKNNYGGGSLHWGHVGDMKHFHRQIQDLHDSVLQQGEYAAPPKAMKEDVDLFDCFEEGIREQVESVYEQLDDEHKQVMIEMIEAEQYEEVVEVVSEVLNG
jgi:hypothetical protein